MKRADAIARFGHHYEIDTYHRTVRETLGPKDEDSTCQHDDSEEALEEMKNRLADKAMERISAINALFDRPANKINLWLARRGWHKRTEQINEAVKKLNAEKAALLRSIRDDFNDAALQPLPAEIKIPALLDKGQSVFVVRACYLEEGIRTEESKITDIRLWQGSMARGDWDYIAAYTATDSKGKAIHFEYNRADTTDATIPNNIHGTHYFLTREAADDFVLDLAARMSAEFAKVAMDTRLRVIARTQDKNRDNGKKKDGPQPAP